MANEYLRQLLITAAKKARKTLYLWSYLINIGEKIKPIKGTAEHLAIMSQNEHCTQQNENIHEFKFATCHIDHSLDMLPSAPSRRLTMSFYWFS